MLGDYLRARRDAGSSPMSAPRRRRVPGLRREELAMLAGISAQYSLQLGRSSSDSRCARSCPLDVQSHGGILHQLVSPTTSRWDHSQL